MPHAYQSQNPNDSLPRAAGMGCPTMRFRGRRRAKRGGNRTAQLFGAPLQPQVYARHGHELMGLKSPVGGPDVIRITTSAGQGQAREGLSEGSPSAKVRAEEHESHRRPSPGASQHLMTKPARSRGRVNAAVVHRKRMFLFGEICPTRRWKVEAQVPAGPTGRSRSRRRGRLPLPASEPGSGAAIDPQRAAQRCASVIG
jgi:hypothetical protein